MTLYDVTKGRQLAQAAARSNGRALEQFLLDTADRLGALSTTELGWLDGITAGTGQASKAVVLDSSGSSSMPDGGLFKHSADALAAAGSSASDAAALADQITVVTGADGAKGVVLPAAADLLEYTVINSSMVYSVKVYPVDSGNDAINNQASNEPYILAPGQETTFKATSATQWYAARSGSFPSRTTHFEIYDDFTDAAIDTTNHWIVFAGTDGDATAAAVATAPEGQVVMGSGDGGSTEDGSVLSLILLAKGSLISLGKTVVEYRVSLDQLTGVSCWLGLSDKLATTAEHLIHTVDSGTVADGGLTVSNAVGFSFSSDATATTQWTITSENAGTIGNAGAEETTNQTVTADTYDVLRIEVDADGTAHFYVNGLRTQTRSGSVATSALLIPYIGIDAGTDAQAVTDLTVDYIYFAGPRPSSNA